MWCDVIVVGDLDHEVFELVSQASEGVRSLIEYLSLNETS